MIIELDMASSTPIYVQLRNQIVKGIGKGELKAGEKLPTVRQLASDAGVNTMTVNKTYQILKNEGFIRTDRRLGAFVSETIAEDADFKEKLKQQLLQHLGKVLDGFSIYNHINGIVKYPFLNADYTVLQTLMSRSMTPFSRVFLTPENSTSTITNIFVKCDDTTMNVWKQRCAPCCQGAPNFGKISSPNQLINIQIEYLKPENITILR